jgi:hypothetical protein
MNLILLSSNIAALSLLLAFLASPKGSEWLGRTLIAHSEALRVYRALVKLARSEYGRAFRGRMEELHSSAKTTAIEEVNA